VEEEEVVAGEEDDGKMKKKRHKLTGRRKNPRRKYLKRLLEICANVNRQNDEIRKVIVYYLKY
jgi:hypothetical protein